MLVLHNHTLLHELTYTCIAAVLVFLTLVAVLHKRAIDHAHSVVIATISLLTVLATFAVDIAFMVTVQKGLRKNASLNGYLAFDAGTYMFLAHLL